MFKLSGLKTFGSIGLGLLQVLMPEIAASVRIVEAAAGVFVGTAHTGKEKQDAALAIAREALKVSETLTDKDLLDDAAFEAFCRATIDMIVAAENLRVKKSVALPSA